MRTFRLTKLAVAVSCGFLGANPSWATLTTIYVSANSGVSGLSSTAYNGSTIVGSSTWAGNWSASIVGGFIPGGHPTSWESFCLDLNNGMGNGNKLYTADSFAQGDPPAFNPPDPMWVAGGGSKAGYLYANHLTDMTTAAGSAALIARSALCIAIWEVLYESDINAYSVSTKNSAANTKGFMVNASGTDALAAVSLANTWLTDAVDDGWNNAPSTTWWRESAGNDPQSLIGPPSMVPEPATYLAGMLLLLPFAASTIRRRYRVS